jgi:hypothetical protein
MDTASVVQAVPVCQQSRMISRARRMARKFNLRLVKNHNHPGWYRLEASTIIFDAIRLEDLSKVFDGHTGPGSTFQDVRRAMLIRPLIRFAEKPKPEGGDGNHE